MRAIMQGLTDAEFEQLYGTEEQCLAAWVKVRQDAGMPCPRCGNPKSYVYDRRVGCTRCDMRWSITSGTVMADTKLPLTTWFPTGCTNLRNDRAICFDFNGLWLSTRSYRSCPLTP